MKTVPFFFFLSECHRTSAKFPCKFIAAVQCALRGCRNCFHSIILAFLCPIFVRRRVVTVGRKCQTESLWCTPQSRRLPSAVNLTSKSMSAGSSVETCFAISHSNEEVLPRKSWTRFVNAIPPCPSFFFQKLCLGQVSCLFVSRNRWTQLELQPLVLLGLAAPRDVSPEWSQWDKMAFMMNVSRWKGSKKIEKANVSVQSVGEDVFFFWSFTRLR